MVLNCGNLLLAVPCLQQGERIVIITEAAIIKIIKIRSCGAAESTA
jgi:hypothetical protein